MNIALVERAKAAQVIGNLDLKRYMSREEMNRVIPAEALAEDAKRRMLLGDEYREGLALPWPKADGKVLVAPGKLVIWAGWSHHGKSSVLKQVMVHAISVSERVCIASMEEEVRDIWCDMCRIATAAKNPSGREIDDWISFCTRKLWFYDQQGSVKADTIKAVVRYAAEELKVTQFVIDSLMMLQVGRDDYEAQSRFVSELKTLADDTRCTIHLVAHMRKREGRIADDAPGSAHDIAGAHDIGSMADYIFNVWRDKQRKDPMGFPAILSVEKQRGRPNWLGRLGLGFDNDTRQYIEGSTVKYCGERGAPV